jgi:hypothetical protein
MSTFNSEPSYLCIEDLLMKEKDCRFEFAQVCVEEVENSCYQSILLDDLDDKLLRMVADCIDISLTKAQRSVSIGGRRLK